MHTEKVKRGEESRIAVTELGANPCRHFGYNSEIARKDARRRVAGSLGNRTCIEIKFTKPKQAKTELVHEQRKPNTL